MKYTPCCEDSEVTVILNANPLGVVNMKPGTQVQFIKVGGDTVTSGTIPDFEAPGIAFATLTIGTAELDLRIQACDTCDPEPEPLPPSPCECLIDVVVSTVGVGPDPIAEAEKDISMSLREVPDGRLSYIQCCGEGSKEILISDFYTPTINIKPGTRITANVGGIEGFTFAPTIINDPVTRTIKIGASIITLTFTKCVSCSDFSGPISGPEPEPDSGGGTGGGGTGGGIDGPPMDEK